MRLTITVERLAADAWEARVEMPGASGKAFGKTAGEAVDCLVSMAAAAGVTVPTKPKRPTLRVVRGGKREK